MRARSGQGAKAPRRLVLDGFVDLAPSARAAARANDANGPADLSNMSIDVVMLPALGPKLRAMREELVELKRSKADIAALDSTAARTSDLAQSLKLSDNYVQNLLPEMQAADEELKRLCEAAEARLGVVEEDVGSALPAQKELADGIQQVRASPAAERARGEF